MGTQRRVGDFILERVGNGLRVLHSRNPDRLLSESATDGNFIIAEKAKADIRAFGTPAASANEILGGLKSVGII